MIHNPKRIINELEIKTCYHCGSPNLSHIGKAFFSSADGECFSYFCLCNECNNKLAALSELYPDSDYGYYAEPKESRFGGWDYIQDGMQSIEDW